VEAERTRGRLESQVKESGAIEQRIAQAEKESQDLGCGWRRSARSPSHQKQRGALEEQIAQARGPHAGDQPAARSLQAKVRERERPSKPAGR
jgi:hypothetical protein